MTEDPVRAKIIELVPEIADRDVKYCSLKNCWIDEHRPITLPDVLRAIGSSRERHGFTIDSQGDKLVMFWSTKDPENPDHSILVRERWNLAVGYDGQTQAVKDFIGKLLGVESATKILGCISGKNPMCKSDYCSCKD